MANIICWICDNNLALKVYEGKLLDEDGNRPCFECVLESGDDEENEEEFEPEDEVDEVE